MTGREPLSLRARIGLALASVLVVSLFTFSVVLHSAFRRALVRAFDARLASDTGAVANMVEVRRDGSLELDIRALQASTDEAGPAYFEIWTPEGVPLSRSPSLGTADLPWALHPPARAIDVTLPDGRPGRAYQATVVPKSDGDVSRPARPIHVVVTRGTGEIDATVATLRTLLVASGVTTLTLALLAGAFVIHRGLAPLRVLADRLDGIDARRLGERLPTEGLPQELHAPVVKLNDMLSRLLKSFDRERRFGADAGHELRTPLAGLRSILEVAASRERPAADYLGAIAEALAVVQQMSRLVESLLALARLDAGTEPPRHQVIGLRELVEACLAPHAARAENRGLRVENRVPDGARLTSDPDRLRIAAANLIANAVEYTAPGGSVVVDSDVGTGRVLTVRDSGPAIPAEAIDKVFDRFFRLDAARSSRGEHWGIGLALVRAVCDTIGLTVSAENSADGSVAFALRLRVLATQAGERPA